MNGNSHFVGLAQCYSTTAGLGTIQMPATMRVTPTGSRSDGAPFTVFSDAGGDIATTEVTFSAGSNKAMRYDFTVAAGLAAGDATFLRGSNASATLDMSAEL